MSAVASAAFVVFFAAAAALATGGALVVVHQADQSREAAEREAHLLRMEVARLHGERVKERSKR
ncbi:hypothetical protein ACUH96_00850 [Dermabacteraceae bacterium P13077]